MINAGNENDIIPGNYYEVFIRPTETSNYRPADYRLWIPDGVQTVRGLIVKQHGCGDDAAATGLDHANDLQWQALALKHQFALLGAKRSTLEFCDGVINRDADDVLLEALRRLTQESSHPELNQVPWVLWGHSGGADWAMYMLHKYPDRTLAVVAMRSGAILLTETSELLTSEINPAVLGVPVLFALGERDPYAEEALELPKQVFFRHRQAGALWALAVEANAGHEAANTRSLAIPYLDAMITARLTADNAQLRPLEPNQGWLANPTTHAIAPIAQYRGEPLEAAWLPNEETARKWQEYGDTGIGSRARYFLCKGERLFVRIGLPYVIQSCYEGKVSPTQKPAAPTNVRATQIGTSEVVLNWNFAPDLENGLPSFRIYRNNALVRTLQGQGPNFGDAPYPPHLVLEFRDQQATADASYRVSAFNKLGETISQPIQFAVQNSPQSAIQ